MDLMDFNYSLAWSQERKDAEWRRYRAECKLRCLEANLDRIAPEEFDALMEQIEAAREEFMDASWAAVRIRAHLGRSGYEKETAQRDMR